MINKKIIVSILLTGFVSLWGVAGVANSPHDLSAIAWGGNAQDGEDNGELCVYCHTPHAANSSFAGAPIWNKDSAVTVANNAFTLYGTTIAGTTAGNAGTVNPPSMACLSCHDGVSAVNSVVNAPGSGVAAGGDELIGDAGAIVITNALLGGATTIANIGSDLSNDHPVSITYDPTKAGLRATTYDISAWVGATTIADILRDTGGTDYVECGSCHDPHNGADTYIAGSSVHFLRVDNAGSSLCLGCHSK